MTRNHSRELISLLFALWSAGTLNLTLHELFSRENLFQGKVLEGPEHDCPFVSYRLCVDSIEKDPPENRTTKKKILIDLLSAKENKR